MNKQKYLMILGILVVVALVVWAFISSNQDTSISETTELLNIGVLAPLTGDVSAYGGYIQNGLTLALDEINGSGGILGREVELIYEDSQCDGKQAVAAAQKLISTDQAPAIIGAVCSSATLPAAPVAESSQTVLLTPISTAAAISEAGDYVFRLTAKDDDQGKQLAELAYEMGYRKPAILYRNDDWGVGLKNAFIENFQGEIVAIEGMEESTTDVKTQLAKIQAAKPDVLFLPCFIKECITSIKQINELGLKLPILSADVFNNEEILQVVGDQADGVVFTFPAEGQGQEWEEFKEKFVSQYGEEPTVNSALAYDALYALKAAIENAQSFDGTEIKNALYQIDFIGPSGRNKFDENGDVDKPFALKTVSNGEFVEYEQ